VSGSPVTRTNKSISGTIELGISIHRKRIIVGFPSTSALDCFLKGFNSALIFIA